MLYEVYSNIIFTIRTLTIVWRNIIMWKKMICGGKCETYLDHLFNLMSEGFALHEIICDDNNIPLDYKFLEVNNSFIEITGLPRKKIVGKRVKDILPEIETHLIDIYGKVALTGEPTHFESYVAALNKHFKISAYSPVKGQFITFFNDVTELKNAAEVLQMHQLLFDNAQDIILYVKPDGSIIDSNKSAAIQYGYSREELLKMKLQDIRHSSTMESYAAEMDSADLNGAIFESIHVKKDGTFFPVEVSAKSSVINNELIRIHIIRNIAERKKAEAEISYLANYDSLTGIPNRGYILRQLKTSIDQAKRGNYKFALMLFDIDKFKRINDTYGHEMGDIVLKETANRVRGSIRESDFLGRLGGDEFIIILPFIKDKEDAITVAKKILEAINLPLKLDDSTEVILSLSIGISIYPKDAEDMESLMGLADNAMYTTKQNGGNSYGFI